MRFDLIDRVLERQEDRLVAVKNVTSAEEYLADHFPGFPVLPGVMMLEVMVQAARLLVAGLSDRSSDGSASPDENLDNPRPVARGRDNPFVVTEVRNVRYGQMVRPGESLKVQVTLRGHDDDGYEMAGIGHVGDQVAVQGRFRMTPLSDL